MLISFVIRRTNFVVISEMNFVTQITLKKHIF